MIRFNIDYLHREVKEYVNMNSKTKKLVMAALFAAIVCVATAVLVIPIPSTGGYLNMGDAVVLFGAFALGPA